MTHLKKEKSVEVVPAFIKGDESLSKLLGGIGPDSLHAMRKAGLPYHRFGGIILYYPEEVTNWVLEHFEKNTGCSDETMEKAPKPKKQQVKHVSIKTQFRR